MKLRRLLLCLAVLATVAAVTILMVDMIRANGVTPLEWVALVLSTVLLLPLSMSFWLAVMGFVVELRGGDPHALDLEAVDSETRPLGTKTAIVVPIRGEITAHVVARLQATRDSLQATGQARWFDFFLLSDTTDPRGWLEEELTVARLAGASAGHIHYRNRPENLDRKAGNIADFCQRWGGRYRYMVVFDADSLMSGPTLVRLVRLMERDPRTGIIQAPPLPVNRRTFFGRLQQFAAGVYGPTWARGLVWLQGSEGNYYGHNAIVRIAPFVEHCRLPTLPGRAPLGGSILSHDFVEAALMLRAGYRVHLVPDLDGSFEEPPPTLIDFAVRDRRWCQGNLQHARLLGMPGLRLMSRLHLLLGVLAYVSSPLWILLLLVSTAEALRWRLSDHEYFPPGGALFPTWEVSIQAEATLLFGLVAGLIFLPRALALLSRCLRGGSLRFGGRLRLAVSALAEWLCSMLLAPVLALMQSRFVLGILLGRSADWGRQPRGDRTTSLGEAIRWHGGTTVLGVLWAIALVRVVPVLFCWMSPLLAGMILAVPLSMLSSSVRVGEWASRAGLFLTPETVSRPPVLARLRKRIAQQRTLHDEVSDHGRSALERVLEDPDVAKVHLAFTASDDVADPLEEHELQGLVLKCRLHGAGALSDVEQRRLLLSPRSLVELGAASPA